MRRFERANGHAGLPPASTRADGWLIAAILLVLAVYIAILASHGAEGVDALTDEGIGLLANTIPVVVCWIATVKARRMRGQLILTALAVTSSAVGGISYVIGDFAEAGSAFVWLAGASQLLFYPLILAALALLIYRQLRGLSLAVALDGVVGGLGAASMLAVVMAPALDAAATGPLTLSSLTMVAMPWLDLLVVAVVGGIAASRTLTAGRYWAVLVSGLLLFAAADVAFAGQILDGGYRVGTLLDAGWAVGLSLVAIWALTSRWPAARARATGLWPLALPALSSAAGLGVLVLASQVAVSDLAINLATSTMLLASLRTVLAFRDVGRMADLRRLARTDDLTGLPNRRALYTDVRLSLALGADGRRALLLLDLDRFKEVNDSLGHDVGDELLVLIGHRLSGRLGSKDLLARLGGDEFAILLDNAGRQEAEVMAGAIRDALAVPFTLAGIALQTSVSIGIALFPEQGADLTSLLRKADMAMYKAKATRTGHRVYRSADDSHGEARLRTLQELRVALHEDQLVVHYQPKVQLTTGEVHGVEALVRWEHPSRGTLAPAQFLDLVEESGLMHALTQIVLAKALDQAARWVLQGRPLTVAVNLSASALIDVELPQRIGAMLRARGLPASTLLLEITEEFLMSDRDRANDILSRLRETGIRIAVDDFGTGYSSLAYLRDLPIDELKLDRSFVQHMADDARAAALVSSAVSLAHSLGLIMVAEGVEDGVAYDELIRYGCDQAQGYHLCRPVPSGELERWLVRHREGSVVVRS
ncbi:EAL domain-containing protein [Cryobacterium sp. PH31-AA6]|uniref:putative bifunctional diguanylate cyclase/phosphodiesterase n=1 Tax=Cryobacterium sp. PH31-AA6 TaxID=3046205 RepID=UPI0024BABB0E|nr:EAL domain-containing protein [Cryobacterium sp. PH31-AA6]MDJ0324415.1 EAL domain-containing protein [Cryobacterium sp. PH31-AA6]